MELAKDAAEPITARKRKAEGDEQSSESKAAEYSAMAAEGPDPNLSRNPNPNPRASSPCSVVEDGWSCSKDDDIMQQHNAIRAEEAAKIPYVGDKVTSRNTSFSKITHAVSLLLMHRSWRLVVGGIFMALSAEFQSGNPIIQEKIKVIGKQYASLRRTRGDGNCFFRSFMFSYLEHILETQDKAEVERITLSIDECKKTLQSLGYSDFTFEDFFSIFLEQLESVLQGTENSISHEELLQRSRDQYISDYVVMFFRFVTSGEIRRRSDFFEPFIVGLTHSTVDKFCKTAVEPMGEESDHVHITALSDALGVAIRVVYLDRSSYSDAESPTVNHHDFFPSLNNAQGPGDEPTAEKSLPKPFVNLLYRPGHYDILYPK